MPALCGWYSRKIYSFAVATWPPARTMNGSAASAVKRERERCPHTFAQRHGIQSLCQPPCGKTEKPLSVTVVTGTRVPGCNGTVYIHNVTPGGSIWDGTSDKWHGTCQSVCCVTWPGAVHLRVLLKHTACRTITTSCVDASLGSCDSDHFAFFNMAIFRFRLDGKHFFTVNCKRHVIKSH